MSLESINQLYENAEKLQVYADLEGSELGEFLEQLIGMVGGTLGCASEEFQVAVANELAAQLAWFEKNTVIIKTNIQPPSYTTEELVYINE